MIPGLMGAHITGINSGSSMREIINALGLTSGLKMLLDAGDLNSYSGSGQTWTDLCGNYSFNRGSGSGSDAADPTFNGTAGKQSSGEYFGFDGGDYFTKSSVNDTFLNSIRKNNALFTIVEVAYANDVTHGASAVFHSGDGWTPGPPDVIIQGGGAVGLNPFFYVGDGIGGVCINHTMSIAATDNSWNFFGLSQDEAAGTLIMKMNASQETSSGVYSSPSAADTTTPWQIGASGSGSVPENAGDRVAIYCMWNRALTTVELTSLYTALKGKFSLP